MKNNQNRGSIEAKIGSICRCFWYIKTPHVEMVWKTEKNLENSRKFEIFIDIFWKPVLYYTMRRKAPKRFTAHFRKKVCRVSVIPALDDRNSDRRCLNYGNQAYLSAQEAARPEGPRLPQENGNRQWPQGPGTSPRQGPRPSVLLRETEVRETLEQMSSGTVGMVKFLRP